MGSEIPFVAEDASHPADDIQVGKWGASLCGCFSDIVPNCCMATYLPFISIAQIAHRMDVARYSRVLLVFLALYVISVIFFILALYAFWDMATDIALESESTGPYGYHLNYHDDRDHVVATTVATGTISAYLSVLGMSASSFFYFIIVWHLRTKVRDRFQLPGNCCFDCCASWYCMCCAIAQMATHVKSYKPHYCDFGPPDTLAAYE